MTNLDTTERKWYVIDTDGVTLGRLASEAAAVLRGKDRPIFTPHVDCGGYAIVIDADKIAVADKKLDQEVYYSHSLYVGGMRETTLRELRVKKPGKVIGNAMKGMFPKRPLGAQMYKGLHVCAGENHGHQAQKPGVLTIKN